MERRYRLLHRAPNCLGQALLVYTCMYDIYVSLHSRLGLIVSEKLLCTFVIVYISLCFNTKGRPIVSRELHQDSETNASTLWLDTRLMRKWQRNRWLHRHEF